MNRNTKRRFEARHDEFARIKRGKSSVAPGLLNIGPAPALDKNPKVARSAADYSRRNAR